MSDGIDNQNLREKTAQGLFWGFLSSGGMQLLNLIIGIFLARLLSPGEYGIVGMLAIFTLLANNLQESGFGVALTVFAGMREQLELVKIPKGMQGMAIVMLSAGLLSLAFMGFSGVDGGLKNLFGII